MFTIPGRDIKGLSTALRPAVAKDFTQQCADGVRINMNCKMSSEVLGVASDTHPALSVKKDGNCATVTFTCPALVTTVRYLRRLMR